jgi:hypothetical protein
MTRTRNQVRLFFSADLVSATTGAASPLPATCSATAAAAFGDNCVATELASFVSTSWLLGGSDFISPFDAFVVYALHPYNYRRARGRNTI